MRTPTRDKMTIAKDIHKLTTKYGMTTEDYNILIGLFFEYMWAEK